MKSVPGFTLLEILIALFIVAIVVSIIFGAYSSTFRVIEVAQTQADVYQMARIAMQRIQEDLECSKLSPVEGIGLDFVGKNGTLDDRDADSLSFLSSKHLALDFGDNYKGTARISFYLLEGQGDDGDEAGDNGFSLFRSDSPSSEDPPADDTGGDILCDHLYSVNFLYYDADGREYEEWDSSDGIFKDTLPSMVRIELAFFDESNPDEPLKFLTNVAVPMARSEWVTSGKPPPKWRTSESGSVE